MLTGTRCSACSLGLPQSFHLQIGSSRRTRLLSAAPTHLLPRNVLLPPSLVPPLLCRLVLTRYAKTEHELEGVPDRWHLYRVVS